LFAAEGVRAVEELVRSPLVIRGVLVSRETERVSAVTRGVGPRARARLVSAYSPTSYVVGLDPETGRVVFHDLVRNRASEEPV